MHTGHLLLRSRHTVTPDGVRDVVVWVTDGIIVAVLPPDDPAAQGAEDLGDRWLIPGLVDTHVHVNEPGRAHWEGFDSATRAAVAGGITTIVDMPLNSIPATTNAQAFESKLAAAEGQLWCDVGFWGGVVPGNTGDLEPLARAGVLGFKCFLSPSGVDEFENVSRADLEEAAPEVARLALPLLVHAEDPASLEAVDEAMRTAEPPVTLDPRSYAAWLASRPASAEVMALAFLVHLALRTGTWIHVVHLAAGDLWSVVRDARNMGVRISCETCPHYLTFAAEEIPDGDPRFKCAPPIREAASREALWEGLRERAIHLVASDHSPCPPDLKRLAAGDVMGAWGGIASLEIGFGAVWHGARARGFDATDVVRWMSDGPSRLAGLQGRKGGIEPGADADLVVWDPDAEWKVDASRLHQRHKVTPYDGRAVLGKVRRTYVHGTLVYAEGEHLERGGDVILRKMPVE